MSDPMEAMRHFEDGAKRFGRKAVSTDLRVPGKGKVWRFTVLVWSPFSCEPGHVEAPTQHEWVEHDPMQACHEVLRTETGERAGPVGAAATLDHEGAATVLMR